jgi:hypothetical protein
MNRIVDLASRASKGSTNDRNPDETLRRSLGFHAGMYARTSSVGARLHSNSWGTDKNENSNMVFDTDSYAYTNQDFLVFFSAGNNGSWPRKRLGCSYC